jgi:hypothetical protein
MKSHRNSHLFWAAAVMSSLVPITHAENERMGASVWRMDEALNHRAAIAAGLAGQPVRKSPRRFDRSLIVPAAVNNDPGLLGSFARKEAQTLQGPINPATAVVNVGSRPSFVELTDAAPPPASSQRSSKAYDMIAHASSLDPRAYLISPAEGNTLALAQNFSWTAGYQAQDYSIWIGSCQDCTDLLDQDLGLAQSVNAYLPTDGRVLFVTLFTSYGGNWYWVDYQFVARTFQQQPAQMISPVSGSTLSSTQTFTWTEATYVDQYYFWIGNCQDCNDILDESEGHSQSRILSLPTDGRTIYVSLFSYISGQWYWYDYQYRAANVTVYTPRIYVTNNLDYPVNVLVNGNALGSVSAQNTQYADVSVSSLSVSFELVRPALSGRDLGDAMTGVFQTIANPSGSYNFTVGTVIGQQTYFEPLITNSSPIPMEIEVNGGLESENRCNCDAPAGSSNVSAGYYKLFSNGNVRLFQGGSNYTGRYWFWGTDSNGYVASSGTLPGDVDGTGRAYLTVTKAP